jgi:hypothetical protein
MSRPLDRELRRLHQERARRRLGRRAYATVYRRVARLIPIVLACSGQLRAYPVREEPGACLERLAPNSVFCFETALELRSKRRLLAGQDMHAYTLSAPTDGVLVPTPPLLPAWSRPPHLFLIVVATLPPSLDLGGRRLVTAERLIREYLGALGHRFDLLAALLHALRDELP